MDDDDLAKRDKMKMNAAFYIDEANDEGEDAYEAEGAIEDLDSESKAAYLAEQTRMDEAYAAIQASKMTLREARWKQKQIERSFKGQLFREGRHTMLQLWRPAQGRRLPSQGEDGHRRRWSTRRPEIAFHADVQEAHDTEVDGLPRIHRGSGGCHDEELRGRWQQQSPGRLGTSPNLSVRQWSEEAVLVDSSCWLERREETREARDPRPRQPRTTNLGFSEGLEGLGATIDFGRNECIFQKVGDTKVAKLKEAPNLGLALGVARSSALAMSRDNTPWRPMEKLSLQGDRSR